ERLSLVTGASSGIGAEFARLLAEQGSDLILTARRRDRLEALATELSDRHAIDVTVVENDLDTPDGPRRLFDEVMQRRRPVTTLVNNAGFGIYGCVVQQDPVAIESMVRVNVTALTALTRLFAAEMEVAGRGEILNVASFAAVQPIPRYAVYSGAKAYVVAFSQALQHELRRSGVTVSVLLPGFTATEFHRVAGHRKTRLMRLTTLDARHVARAGLAGVAKGKIVIIPGLWYKACAVGGRFLPRRLAAALAAATVKGDRA
ncbi:MAG: SDR family NAD(P)-dependent oxidoreductase, partial [Pirellulales bacterium]